MRGEISTGKHAKRHPLDWYVDEVWCARQLARALGDFAQERERGLAIYDPSAGYGNTLQAAFELGLQTYASDLVQNVNWPAFDECPELPRPKFFSADFLALDSAPAPCSFCMNPPYSYIPEILEAFVRHALRLATKRVCVIVPIKWQSSQGRYQLFRHDYPPQAILHSTQRPSMPPGDRISAMGKRAFRGGSTDYCWMIWDVEHPTKPHETRTIWLPPLDRLTELEPIEGLA